MAKIISTYDKDLLKYVGKHCTAYCNCSGTKNALCYVDELNPCITSSISGILLYENDIFFIRDSGFRKYDIKYFSIPMLSIEE